MSYKKGGVSGGSGSGSSGSNFFYIIGQVYQDEIDESFITSPDLLKYMRIFEF